LDYSKVERLLYYLALASRKVSLTDSKKITKKLEKAKTKFMASKKSHKLHLPECIWAKQISNKNLIQFDKIKDAEKIGYSMHDCVVVHPKTKKKQKISERNKEAAEIRKGITKLEKLIKNIKANDNYDKKKLDMIEVRLKINKSKLAKIWPQN